MAEERASSGYVFPEAPVVERRRDLDLSGRVAIITGASQGIGEGIARAFYEHGAFLVLNSRTEKTLEDLAQSIDPDGTRVLIHAGDISLSQTAKDMVNAAVNKFERVDILVNNAGITGKDNVLMAMRNDDDIAEILNTNLVGAIFATREVIRPMIKTERGRIINMSSVVPAIGAPTQPAYAVAKAGLEGLTRQTAKEYASRNITANAIAPGAIWTEMLLASERKYERRGGVIATFVEHTPMNRVGLVNEVADVALFIASDMSSYMTGNIIDVNGGMYFRT